MARRVSLAVCLGALLAPGAAWAQDVAAADALFKRGVGAMKAGDLETACPAIAESQRLDPHPGTVFTLAECERKRGRVATAAVHYATYLSQVQSLPVEQRAKHEERRKLAASRGSELAPHIPRLTLTLPSSAPSRTEVRRDGTALGAASLGVALPVDPGPHTVVARTPDGRERETAFDLAEGEQRSLEVPLPDAAVVAAPPPPPPPEPRSPSPHTGAYVLGGLGVLALGASGVSGALVLGKKSTVTAHCVDVVCDAQGKQAADSAKTLGLVSTISFGVGLAAVATSVVLLLTGGDDAPPRSSFRLAPALAPRAASLEASTRF